MAEQFGADYSSLFLGVVVVALSLLAVVGRAFLGSVVQRVIL